MRRNTRRHAQCRALSGRKLARLRQGLGFGTGQTGGNEVAARPFWYDRIRKGHHLVEGTDTASILGTRNTVEDSEKDKGTADCLHGWLDEPETRWDVMLAIRS